MVAKNPYVDVLSLSVEERLALLEYLWESIVDHPEAVPLTEEQRRELDKRLAAYQRDKDPGSPWEVVKSRIMKP